MRPNAVLALGFAVGLAALPARAARNDHGGARPFSQPLSKDEKIEQAVNRLTFGPRAGDAALVRAVGLKKWLDMQLHPARIAENPALAEKLRALDTLTMPAEEMVRDYPPPQIIRQMVAGDIPFPADPERQRVIRMLAERLDTKKGAPEPAEAPTLEGGTPQLRLAAFEALPIEKQDEVMVALPAGVRQGLLQVAPPELRRKIELAAGPQQLVARDLAEAKLLRAIYSNRQLEEVLADFWFNHFNVYLDKGADHYLVTSYERDAIRPRVLGRFRDLLEATAKSPAMLFYLDNWESARPSAARARAGRGLNENYGRELLELHTLGVDGGYTQKDVTEVARCFTGWTIARPQRGGGFVFNKKLHDDGEKVVLGVRIRAGGGIEDGEKVLDILARHPSTARFISLKLAQRFVADDPPASLVDRMARTFVRTDGDLRAVMKTMLGSREFWSRGAWRSKTKSPLEVVASAVRAVNGDVDTATALVNQVAQLGEPLYRKSEPTGYSNAREAWLSSAGLLARMNFAVRLASNRIPGVKVSGADALALGAPAFQEH